MQNYTTKNRRKYIPATCQECQQAYQKRSDDKTGRFCSQRCSKAEKVRRGRVELSCEQCKKLFTVPKSQLLYRGRRYCSRQCHHEAMWGKSDADKIIALGEAKVSAKEIAARTGKSLTAVYTRLVQRLGKKRRKSSSQWFLRRQILNSASACLICGWTRCLDLAHIVPASAGGTLDEGNLIPLCPNHHRLFDARSLTAEEAEKLAARVSDYQNYIGRKEKTHGTNGAVGD